ncbi:MAG: hypothetical protein A3G33_10620 [Omnitrophica bacterium RIFCSPLOWO2_12_FULL_44_17]|uniref:N-acetyltransferase domain-containing protein n=1 Tax=Candidatus Danuiimicrobium aquiferis TaxID=1801832 RepID=A0A1G1KRJ0_9BACT|nr:MAG: hypothetical protein A3B72_02940 [Omnitrophica bacterium RIFCSPHIGHO2_02_FULL_45_28]OGW89506.1 MAG: hypothetical protein A3E74_06970 [Omnitrophica bacterium RIFCSPHIGHO2_12_FULL_44_12]OGW95422.1 MAG: hypothetical protein A3G33_10620 [Omnitrophica bacterium RIFCSPLOWO2_12_FULL_44_17]OGX03304.1 MAG: hypothetical protein A3J12_07255 [Omnitrophica bacterium RIFCSPLOWO2_02_FULL_44_11]
MTQNNSIKIQKCEKQHVESVRSLIEGVLSKEFPAEHQAYPPNDLMDILDSYGKLGEAFFVALDHGTVVGTVGIKKDDDRTALLRRLFVLPEYRGKKLGEKLVERAIDFCHEVGYDELIFKTTSTMKNANRLCEHVGFLMRARLDLGPIQLMKYMLNLKKTAGELSRKG